MERRTGGGTSLKRLKILAVRCQIPSPVELVGQTDQDHCSATGAVAAGSVGTGAVEEGPEAVVG